jgi:hypothetical protein
LTKKTLGGKNEKMKKRKKGKERKERRKGVEMEEVRLFLSPTYKNQCHLGHVNVG